ncbi:MAG: hypothetical protein ABL891_04770 [Burkholderiales bacterium]
MTDLHGYRYRSSVFLEYYVVQAERDEMSALRSALGLSSIDSEIAKAIRDFGVEQVVREVVTGIERAGGNSILNSLRGGGVSYLEILYDFVKKFQFENTLSYNDLLDLELPDRKAYPDEKASGIVFALSEEWEGKIVAEVLKRTYEHLTPAQRKDFDSAIAKTLERQGVSTGKGLAGAAGIMAIANMGGFATYTLLSTVLSTASFGALGFGAYTFASSLLHLVIGPVGWIALASYGAAWLARPDQKKCLSLILLISVLRQRVNAVAVSATRR